MYKKVSILILISGILFSISFLFCVRKNVFYSGDGGLKYLQTKQIADGDFSLSINFKCNKLTEKLWSKGYFPLKEPFIYKIDNKYYTPFPYIFSLITAPFYILFGFVGLRFIPMVFLWGIWFIFFYYLRKFNLNSLYESLFLFILIFASPLTFYGAFYGATYWEHTIGVFLGFSGFMLCFYEKKYFWGGLLLSIASLFRPELLFFGIIIFLFIILNKEISKVEKINFLKGFLPIIIFYFLFNLLIFKNPLGLRSNQVVLNFSKNEITNKIWLIKKLNQTFTIEKDLLILLLLYFPQIFLLLMVPGMIFFKVPGTNHNRNNQIKIAFSIFIFLLTIPFIIPNIGGKQFGPRYLLILIPVSLIYMSNFLKITPKKIKVILVLLLLLISVKIFYKNSILARKTFCMDLENSLLIDFIKNEKTEFIVVNHQWIVHNLLGYMGVKSFLLYKNREQLKTLLYELAKNEIEKIYLININFEKSKNRKYPNFKINNVKIKSIHVFQTYHYNFFKIYIINKKGEKSPQKKNYNSSSG